MEHTPTYEAKDVIDPKSMWGKTGPPRFMVPQSSACLDWSRAEETKVAISTDHCETAKLNNNVGSAYSRPYKRRRQADLAPQYSLSLLFILQYEYFWLSGIGAVIDLENLLTMDTLLNF